MRRLLVVCLALVASPAFAQNWKTSRVQAHFASNVVVSNSSTAADQVALTGELAAVVAIQRRHR